MQFTLKVEGLPTMRVIATTDPTRPVVTDLPLCTRLQCETNKLTRLPTRLTLCTVGCNDTLASANPSWPEALQEYRESIYQINKFLASAPDGPIEIALPSNISAEHKAEIAQMAVVLEKAGRTVYYSDSGFIIEDCPIETNIDTDTQLLQNRAVRAADFMRTGNSRKTKIVTEILQICQLGDLLENQFNATWNQSTLKKEEYTKEEYHLNLALYFQLKQPLLDELEKILGQLSDPILIQTLAFLCVTFELCTFDTSGVYTPSSLNNDIGTKIFNLLPNVTEKVAEFFKHDSCLKRFTNKETFSESFRPETKKVLDGLPTLYCIPPHDRTIDHLMLFIVTKINRLVEVLSTD
jgi:hypothetical protein